jgi:hypothetical protein
LPVAAGDFLDGTSVRIPAPAVQRSTDTNGNAPEVKLKDKRR